MINLKFKTKGNANPNGKPRIFFACHPADFANSFDLICDAILKTHDCAIYYTPDMDCLFAEEEKETVLGRHNLFVVPVTFALLSEENRAMAEDIPFAFANHIPVLPVLMEGGLDELYALPNKFGNTQYLSFHTKDPTELPFAEKLKKYLDSVLISDEVVRRIRAAFDAYIFLSYRKKDRLHANDLIRLIHSHPACQQIAVWYDEFLVPGENFRENIDHILQDSKLFTLLVTPNILEETDGKPNFVMGEEYPKAKKMGMDILPMEMEATDKGKLAQKFGDLPPCETPYEEASKERFLQVIQKNAKPDAKAQPEHSFLMGTAYLEGIDVEVDRKRGVERITAAAEENLPEAMEKLFWMYDGGIGLPQDFATAAHWAEKLALHYAKKLGDEHLSTLHWRSLLADAFGKLGDTQKSLNLSIELYKTVESVYGEGHPITLEALNKLAKAHSFCGNSREAFVLTKKLYALRSTHLGKDHPQTLAALANLSVVHQSTGDLAAALACAEESYTQMAASLGEEHTHTLYALANLAMLLNQTGRQDEAIVLGEKAVTLQTKVAGEDHIDTLHAKANLCNFLERSGDLTTALKMSQAVYYSFYKKLGEAHPDTLRVQANQAILWGKLGDIQRQKTMMMRVLALTTQNLGENHPKVLPLFADLATICGKQKDFAGSVTYAQKAAEGYKALLGEAHDNTKEALFVLAASKYNLGLNKWQAGDLSAAKEHLEKAYTLTAKTKGDTHPLCKEIRAVLEALQ